MNRIKTYKKFKDERVNEEFIGELIKGALGKLFNAFSAPWKDLVNDLKGAFKEDDPNSLRGIIMKNFNEAVDGLQKQLPSLKDDASVLAVMDDMIKSLTDLANGMGKDIETSFGTAKSPAVEKTAKAIILGNKETKWLGIIGLLNSPNYKYAKDKYVTEVNKGQDLKGKIDIANKFLDNMQKDIQAQLDKDFNADDLVKVFKSTEANGAEDEEYGKGDLVYYILKGGKEKYDKNKTPDDQKDLIGQGPIIRVDGDKFIIGYGDGENTEKTKNEIVGKVPPEDQGQNAQKAHKVLGELKADDVKMGQIVNYAEFIKNPENKDKVDEIEKIIAAGPPIQTTTLTAAQGAKPRLPAPVSKPATKPVRAKAKTK